MKDENNYQIQNRYDEWINTSSLFLGHSLTSSSFQLQAFYNADVSMFGTNSAQNNYANQFGLYSKYIGDKYSFDFRASSRIRRNHSQYIYYNVNNYNLTFNFRHTPKISQIFSLGFMAAKENYTEFEDLNNFTYRFWGRYQQFFQSKISLSGEAGVGVKKYVNQTIFNYYGLSGPGRFRDFSQRFTEEPVEAVMFSIRGNIAKSISEKTGINAGFGGQWFIGDPIEAYSNGIYYYTENDLYDDPYSYQDKYISLYLTRQFTLGFKGKIGLEYHDKDYRGTPALDVLGEPMGVTREDTRKRYSILLSKKFFPNWGLINNFELFFNFAIRDNPSNDPYYNFTDHMGLLGFSIGK
jgi:hypothetical protein